MKQNKNDDINFFNKYSKMERSIGGLESAGEWHILKTMLPSFEGKRVLDIGCGFGWHCRYASEQKASSIVGIDISEKIGSYETSIQPFEDCCTIFVAKHPVTKPNLNVIKQHETNLDGVIEELYKTAIETTEKIVIE